MFSKISFMKVKIVTVLILLFSCATFSQTCTDFPEITASTTSVCSGNSVNLSVNNPSLPSQSPMWSLLIPSTAYNGNLLNLSETGYDRVSNTIFSIYKQGSGLTLYKFNLNLNTVSSLNSTVSPSAIGPFTYDFSNNRLISGRTGRDPIYAVSANGGAWTTIGTGSFDQESYGAQYYWNSNSQKTGFFGGYGFFAVKNWVWESGGSWTNVFANNSNCNLTIPAKRNTQLALGAPNTNKMYFFSGQGSCSGAQTATSCSLSSPWATDVGIYCWLKDLWELNLTNHTFVNILPVNSNSIIKEGNFTYNYVENSFYIVGGYTPSATYNSNIGNITNFETSVVKFVPGSSTGFVAFPVSGTPPPTVTLNNLGNNKIYFDATNNQIVWIRKDGVWAIKLNTSSSSSSTYLWSTGAITSTINPTPITTTTYWVDITTNGLTCRKEITIIVNNITSPIVSANQVFCNSGTVSNLVSSGISIKWYDAIIGGNLLPSTTALVNGSIYYASQTINSCESTRVPVTVSVNSTSTPTGTATQSFCNSATVADIAVTGVGVNWYSSALGGTVLASTTPLVNGASYFASQTINSCSSPTRFSVLVTIIPPITPIFSSIPNQLCHNSLAPILPLLSNNATPIYGTWIPSVVSTSSVGNSSYLFTPNSGQCVSLAPIVSTINVIPKRVPNFSDIAFCKGKLSPILSNTSPNGIAGTWSPAIVNNNISTGYTFTPNFNECAIPKTIQVTINEATLLSIEYLVSGDFTDNQIITVIATNPGNYLYQLDFGIFQSSNIFQNVTPGIHTIKVVDVNGCSQELTIQNVVVINYPRFFSPNGDSYNDYWNIIGFLNAMKPKIFIYDRYGKLVKQIKPYELGWDGLYNGKELPATDYWFTAEYQDSKGNNQQFKSHFSLIR